MRKLILKKTQTKQKQTNKTTNKNKQKENHLVMWSEILKWDETKNVDGQMRQVTFVQRPGKI